MIHEFASAVNFPCLWATGEKALVWAKVYWIKQEHAAGKKWYFSVLYFTTAVWRAL